MNGVDQTRRDDDGLGIPRNDTALPAFVVNRRLDVLSMDVRIGPLFG